MYKIMNKQMSIKSIKSIKSINDKKEGKNIENVGHSAIFGGALEDIKYYPGELKIEDVFKLIDLYFKQKNIMYSHHYNSFDKFIEEDIPDLLKNSDNIFYEKFTRDKVFRYKFKYEDISIKPAMIESEDEIMYPSDARLRDLTYSSKIVASVSQMQEIIDIATGDVLVKQIGDTEYEYPIALVPIMVKSKYCSLNLKKGKNTMECDYDPGAHFIINGAEKVIMTLERIIDNKPLIFTKKDGNTLLYACQINSKSPINDMIQIHNTKMRKDETIGIKVTFLNEVPVFVMMRALGIESDREIINYTVYDTLDTDMINLVEISLKKCVSEDGYKIMTQDDALAYLMTQLRVVKKYQYSESDKNLRAKEKKMHLLSLLNNSFLPHIQGDLIHKAYYLGYMINKLLLAYLKRTPIDDRDSFVNKRLDLPGPLLFELFKQSYKKMLNECNKFFRKRNNDDANPHVIINQIKPNIIEQGLKTALSTGKWGKKNGVAQMLMRLSYLQMISTLRRINSPTYDASTNKLTGPRHLHGTPIGSVCFIETPEGHKIGLVKSLSLMGNITIGINSQANLIRGMLLDKIIDISDIPSYKLKDYTKILLNGEWLGVTDKPMELYTYMKQQKLNNNIDINTSVVYEIKSEIENKEIKIYTDGGRLFRPLLRVENNKILLTKEHINMISLDNYKSATNITTWKEFMNKHPGIIEYVDVDEQYNSMLSMFPNDIELMRTRMENSIKLVENMDISNNSIINRYDDMVYVKYTHCEIHPSMMIGVVVGNIPFANCNQAPRNIFQYSQAKQAMGLYSTSYRDRADISHILYHTQRPLVNTKLMKYIGTDVLPAGENAIVAIGCYTGSNQEDSLVLNKSAIDRGLYRSSSLKKFKTTIQKNQSTSQDDLFVKPDPTKVAGKKPGSYDKLNEQGFAPEETELFSGDIIIGKISPIQPIGNSNKTFKDSSEVYKEKTPGAVDKVWTHIYNNDGYEMRKVRTRSERTPVIGDKFCSRAGQKGTAGVLLSYTDMPFTKDGIVPDIIVNPNALPSRMTIGQLIECLIGKVSAIRGHETDGTPFRVWDLDAVKNILESLGYDRHGREYLYNGMTGRKIKTMMYIGPTYYQRLKHMVNDKQHARARGTRTILTKQAPEGRSRDGGLRFGEMERDSVIAHGMARFLKERMMETADAMTTYICDICGLLAQRMLRKDNKSYTSENDIYYCQACKNKNRISTIRIPYAFKLLVQEMMAMNIAPRIRVSSSKYD
jgi:DNA-directed RNA polymerase II subunit RPB2